MTLKPIGRAFVAFLAAVAISMPAKAGGVGVGMATEVTQLLNNAELIKVAIDQATTAANMVNSYATQLQQFGLQQLNIKGLTGLPTGLVGDALNTYNNLLSYKQALGNLQGSLGNQQTLMTQRITEARLGGYDLQSYLARVGQDVANGNARAVTRLQQEEAALQQVQADYEFVRSVQTQIPSTVGQHQAIQLLNSQMNRVITQNAKIIELMTVSINRDAQTSADEAESRARNAATRELLRQRQQNVEQRQKSFGGL